MSNWKFIYRKIRGENVNFFRGKPSDIRQIQNQLKMDIFDTTTNKLFEIKTDILYIRLDIESNIKSIFKSKYDIS